MPDTLASYLPRLVFQRVVSPLPLSAAEASRSSAAILFSDIQGFTSLVELFTRSGRAGLEELTWVLNGYFTDLVELVYGHGGDVLYIAGDAFLCYWPASGPDELPETVLRAAQAGLAIQSALDGRPCGKGLNFATRVGVSAGDLSVAFAGGHGRRWELIVSGPAIKDVVGAEKQAAAGSVVLSELAWSAVAPRCTGRPVSEGHVVLDAVDRPLSPVPTPPRAKFEGAGNDLEPFIPPAVLDRRQLQSTEWLAEQRTISVLMADLPELGEATADSLERTHVSIRAFQQVVERFEGTVKVDVDDKGILLLAVFGLPPRAHEDDAERAVRAAWALKGELERLGVHCGTGIATGRAFCGAFGSELRREYMLRGDVINLAARLMQTTSHEILCDETTTHAVRGRIEFEEHSTLSVKGRRAPVRVHRPTVKREQHGRSVDSPVIGRVAERRLVDRELSALREGGRGSVVIFEGEAGVGKSRLVSDAGQKAEGLRVRVLTAAADAIERSTAYYAWRRVFQSVFELGTGLDPAVAREKVTETMAAHPALARLIPLLSSVLPVQIPDNELTAEMTGDVRADNTRQLLARLIQQVASETPTLLVIEDAHWLDSNSWALLLEVVRSVRPLLVVVALRPGLDPEGPQLSRLAQLAEVHRVDLEGLSPEETDVLILDRLGVDSVPAELAKFVQERVAGHPFYCEELLQSMREAGTIRVHDGVCEVGDLSALDLPSTVEGVILSRLDRLTSGQQLCLKVASVVGRTFRTRTVRETIPSEPERERVPDHLEALTGQSLTLRDSGAAESTYLFKHVLTRDVTYELMPLVLRQPMHRAVAEWYERNFADDLTPHYALLAYHWGRAKEPAKTGDYLEKSGTQALRGGAFREALLFFSQVIELERDGDLSADRKRRALWDKGLGTAHYFLGDLQNSRARLESAVGMLDRPFPRGTGATARSATAATLTQACHRLLPRRYLGRRQELKAALDEAVDCYKILGQIYYLEGEPALPVIYITLRGLNVGEEAGASSALARILSNTATLTSLLGATRWADGYARRALEMAGQEGQYAAAAYVWSILALMHAQRGDWARARHANEEAMKLIQELGDYNLEPEAWVVRATVNICEGDFAAAPQAWRRARELAQRNQNSQIFCWSLLDEVDTLLGRGETEAAARVLDEALAVPTRESDRSSTIDKQRALAMTRLRQGRFAEAVPAADTVVEMVSSRQPTGYFWVDFCASAVETYLCVLESGSDYAQEHRVALEDRVRRGCKLLRRLSRNFWNVRPRTRLLDGLRLWHESHRARALRDWHEARDTAVRMNMPFEEARALLEIGRHTTGSEREAGLDRAARIFERHGATYYVECVAQARDGL